MAFQSSSWRTTQGWAPPAMGRVLRAYDRFACSFREVCLIGIRQGKPGHALGQRLCLHHGAGH